VVYVEEVDILVVATVVRDGLAGLIFLEFKTVDRVPQAKGLALAETVGFAVSAYLLTEVLEKLVLRHSNL
jgi:hypothetical protein